MSVLDHRDQDYNPSPLTCSSKLSPVLPTNSMLTASNSRLPSPVQFRGRRPTGASAGYRP